MTGWAWALVWAVLVVCSLGFLLVLGRSLWRAAGALLAELSTASDRFAAVSGELSALGGPAAPAEPAVFADVHELRRRRTAAARRRARSVRRGG